MEKEITAMELIDLLVGLMSDMAESMGWNEEDENYEEFYDEFTLRMFMDYLAEDTNMTYIINPE